MMDDPLFYPIAQPAKLPVGCKLLRDGATGLIA